MTAPKRWYQLSMLQMLVAMAVVAVLIAFNLTTCYHSTLKETRDGLTKSYAIERSRTGWPAVFFDTCKRIPLDGGNAEEFVLRGSGEKAIHAFMIDVLVAVTVIAITVMCAEKRVWSWILSLSCGGENQDTVPKRWYQLSILQLLVAMAVVAGFCWANRLNSLPIGYHVQEGSAPFVNSGWPFQCFRKTYSRDYSNLTCQFESQILPLLGNVMCCLGACVCACGAISVVTRKLKPCPSPST